MDNSDRYVCSNNLSVRFFPNSPSSPYTMTIIMEKSLVKRIYIV